MNEAAAADFLGGFPAFATRDIYAELLDVFFSQAPLPDAIDKYRAK
ncbi:MAG: hypothetical protein ABIK89_18710 [Planctomycetota bacterium]